LFVVLSGVSVFAGCGRAEPTITVTSEPSGALVFANDVEVGRTPVTFDITWYGDYRFEVVKEGYERLRTHQRIYAHPAQWLGVDLFFEVFVPVTIRSNTPVHFELTPLAKISEADLVEAARKLRDETLHGAGDTAIVKQRAAEGERPEIPGPPPATAPD
jgi:hypothetical protein